jgi:hypothetical protein
MGMNNASHKGSRNNLLHFFQKCSRFWERLRHFSIFEKLATQAFLEIGLLRPYLFCHIKIIGHEN